MNLNYWIDRLETHANQNLYVLLVGNKSDLVARREVSTAEASAFAMDHGFLYTEISALNGLHITEALQELNEKIYQSSSEPTIPLIRRVYYEPDIKEPESN